MANTPEFRLAEVLGALSYALDLAEGQAAGHALRSCLIGMELAARAGLDADQRSALYYALLLKDIGCSSNASRTAVLLGADDQDAKRAHKLTDWTRRPERFRWAAAVVGRDDPPRERARRLAGLARGKDINRDLTRMRCERGAQIAEELGFPPATATAIYALDEHWDGTGHPGGRRGMDIPLLARIACLAQTMEVFTAVRGPSAGIAVGRRRRGRWFDPALVDLLDVAVLRALPDEHADLVQAVNAYEPHDRVLVADESRVSRIAHAFAEVIDAKSPSTGGHSHRVAALADAIGERLGRAPDRSLVRAALLHDIGKLALSSRILDKSGPLTEREWIEVRSHPAHTEALLNLVPPLRPIAATAAMHHERLDGSGYPRGLLGDELPPDARLLAVADVYEALTARRSYRAPVTSDAAVAVLRDEARAGRLDDECVEALAAFVGEPGRDHGAPTVA